MTGALNKMRILSLLLLSIMLSAQSSQSNQWLRIHKSEKEYWAKREHISADTIDQITISAGLGAGDEFNIDNLDMHSLASRKQVLLSTWVTVGAGHCLNIYVLRADKGKFRGMWSTYQINAEQDLCVPSTLGAAHAYAASKDVFVQIPLAVRGDPDTPTSEIELLCARFSWNGNAYKVRQSDRKIMLRSEYRVKGHLCSSET